MNNDQRKRALAKARANALEHAEIAEKMNDESFDFRDESTLAIMWAHVAQAMKTGGALEADGVIPDPIDVVSNEYGVITR